MKISEQTIQQVLEDFQSLARKLVESAESLRSTNAGIREEVEGALVQLQFQDRISQILCHVRDNIDTVGVQLRSNATAGFDVSQVLREMEASYAMAEERDTHGKQHGKAPATSGSDITFF